MHPLSHYIDQDLAPPEERVAPSPAEFMMALAFVNMIGFAGWNALINNFAREQAGFGWFETGLTQTFREIPGLLAFTAVFWLMWLREQTVGYASLVLLALGVGLTGLYPSLGGILVTTVIMSFGFHYFETINYSLQLQLLRGADAPMAMGRIQSAASAAQFVAYGLVFVLSGWLGVASYPALFGLFAVVALGLTALSIRRFPRYDSAVPQGKHIVLRRRYGLYYALTFMSGARRQIFSAFGAFLLVDRFGLSVSGLALLFLVTALVSTLLASRLGQLVGRLGERRTMLLENLLLIGVFSGYALTGSATVAVVLFILDGASMTLMIAQRTYFQKIGDPSDMAATTSVAFTFNHIAAVVIPVTFGLLGRRDPSLIFWLGTAIATSSLALAALVPQAPAPGREMLLPGFFQRGPPRGKPLQPDTLAQPAE